MPREKTGTKLITIPMAARGRYSFNGAIRSRIDHPLHWMPFAWGIPILLFSVQYWFGLFDLDSTIGDWNWFWYLQMLVMAIALFMAAALILPPREAAAKGGLLEDFTTHGRYSLLALVAYLLGWIPANTVMNNGNVLELGSIANAAMVVPALIAVKFCKWGDVNAGLAVLFTK